MEQSMSFKTFTRFAAAALIAFAMPIVLTAQEDQNCSSRGASIKLGDTAAVQPLCDALQ
jgi:hypothetical protein